MFDLYACYMNFISLNLFFEMSVIAIIGMKLIQTKISFRGKVWSLVNNEVFSDRINVAMQFSLFITK